MYKKTTFYMYSCYKMLPSCICISRLDVSKPSMLKTYMNIMFIMQNGESCHVVLVCLRGKKGEKRKQFCAWWKKDDTLKKEKARMSKTQHIWSVDLPPFNCCFVATLYCLPCHIVDLSTFPVFVGRGKKCKLRTDIQQKHDFLFSS